MCRLKGLTGAQGVMIPRANLRHLMLRPDVVDAVKANKFHIYAVGTIDEGIEVLTGARLPGRATRLVIMSRERSTSGCRKIAAIHRTAKTHGGIGRREISGHGPIEVKINPRAPWSIRGEYPAERKAAWIYPCAGWSNRTTRPASKPPIMRETSRGLSTWVSLTDKITSCF